MSLDQNVVATLNAAHYSFVLNIYEFVELAGESGHNDYCDLDTEESRTALARYQRADRKGNGQREVDLFCQREGIPIVRCDEEM